MRARYLLLLSNNYSNKKWCVELRNTSCDPREYVFDCTGEAMPDDLEYGVYDYALLHCAIPYDVEFARVLLDSVVKTQQGEFALRDLRPETGMLEFRPDAERGPYGWCEKINERLYDDSVS